MRHCGGNRRRCRCEMVTAMAETMPGGRLGVLGTSGVGGSRRFERANTTQNCCASQCAISGACTILPARRKRHGAPSGPAGEYTCTHPLAIMRVCLVPVAGPCPRVPRTGRENAPRLRHRLRAQPARPRVAR
eukprot:3157607-Prymnesium_polylepis.1